MFLPISKTSTVWKITVDGKNDQLIEGYDPVCSVFR
jgi:hypothetical protein